MSAPTERRIVLLLGAGFSARTRLPLMTGFGQRSRERLALVRRDVQSKVGHVLAGARRIEAAGYSFAAFQDYCRRAKEIVAVDADNMEHVFSIAEAMRESGTNYRDDFGVECTQDLIERISLWLWYVYQALPAVLEEEEGAFLPYHNIVEALGPHASHTAVLTTNYDLAFEYAATRGNRSVSIRYPWRSSEVEHLPLATSSTFLAPDCADACVVCHLHGATNFFHARPRSRTGSSDHQGAAWGRGQQVDENMGLSIATERTVKGCSYGGYLIHDSYRHRLGMPVTLCSYSIADFWECHRDLVPALVPPTYAKLDDANWLRRTWQFAVDALRTARLIVVVGYGMPDSDGFMRAMIQTAMAQRDPGSRLKVLVVDPSPIVLSRYADFLYPTAEQRAFQGRRARFEDWAACKRHQAEFADLLRRAVQG